MSRNKAALFTSHSDHWRTPPALFQHYDSLYHFHLDGAADHTNHLCPQWYGPDGLADDALTSTHCDLRIWLNPPYSRVKEFVAKAAADARHNNLTVALLPARTDTKWFHTYIYSHPHVRVELLKGRVKFLNHHGICLSSAPFPSMVVTFFPHD